MRECHTPLNESLTAAISLTCNTERIAMLSRTLAASVLPRGGRLRATVPSWRTVRLRLTGVRRRSLLIQERAESARRRHTERYGYGRRT